MVVREDQSNSELRKWIAEHKSDTAEYIAGIEEIIEKIKHQFAYENAQQPL